MPAVSVREGTAMKAQWEGVLATGSDRGLGSRGVECRPTWTWIPKLMWRCQSWWSGEEGLYIDVQGPGVD